MPLSEHEQQMFDQIERALYDDDPKFATSVDVTRIRRRRPIAAGSVFLVGLVCLVVGVITTQSVLTLGVIVSVIGFLAMVGGAALFVFGVPGRGKTVIAAPSKNRAGGGVASRMEERVRRRFDEQE